MQHNWAVKEKQMRCFSTTADVLQLSNSSSLRRKQKSCSVFSDPRKKQADSAVTKNRAARLVRSWGAVAPCTAPPCHLLPQALTAAWPKQAHPKCVWKEKAQQCFSNQLCTQLLRIVYYKYLLFSMPSKLKDAVLPSSPNIPKSHCIFSSWADWGLWP